jgi:spoIIIJ-associated protein
VIEVVSKGKTGFLGLGGEEVRVRATLLHEDKLLPRKAKELVDKIIDFLGVSAAAHIDSSPDGDDTTTVSIEGDDSGLLIGHRGETLRAFQYVVNILLAREFDEGLPVRIDVERYKETKDMSLKVLAARVADRVANSREAVTLEPMTGNDRRIIHMALADHSEVITKSDGEGDDRKVSVIPKSD